MRLVLYAAILTLAATASLGCEAGGRASAFSAADEAAIRQASADFTAATLAKDRDALDAIYTDDAVVMPPGAPTRVGRSEFSDLVAPLTITDFELKTIEIEGRGDLAYARHTYAWTVRIGDGDPMPDRGKALTIWRRQPDGRWLLSRDIWNSDFPAP